MFWLYAIEPMSFGQISNVKRTHERRSYPFKDASITRIIIITSYSVWGHGREGQHAHSIENHHIDADCINRFESDYKFVEPALSFILLTRKRKLSHSFLLSFLQIRFHPVFFFFSHSIRHSSDNAIERPEQHIIIVYSESTDCASVNLNASVCNFRSSHFFFFSLLVWLFSASSFIVHIYFRHVVGWLGG